MARSSPEKLAAALRANLKRRKGGPDFTVPALPLPHEAKGDPAPPPDTTPRKPEVP